MTIVTYSTGPHSKMTILSTQTTEGYHSLLISADATTVTVAYYNTFVHHLDSNFLFCRYYLPQIYTWQPWEGECPRCAEVNARSFYTLNDTKHGPTDTSALCRYVSMQSSIESAIYCDPFPLYDGCMCAQRVLCHGECFVSVCFFSCTFCVTFYCRNGRCINRIWI